MIYQAHFVASNTYYSKIQGSVDTRHTGILSKYLYCQPFHSALSKWNFIVLQTILASAWEQLIIYQCKELLGQKEAETVHVCTTFKRLHQWKDKVMFGVIQITYYPLLSCEPSNKVTVALSFRLMCTPTVGTLQWYNSPPSTWHAYTQRSIVLHS